jgi:hypothetical protein
VVILFTLNHTDKNRQIYKLEKKEAKSDSINHTLYTLLGAKQILDSLK